MNSITEISLRDAALISVTLGELIRIACFISPGFFGKTQHSNELNSHTLHLYKRKMHQKGSGMEHFGLGAFHSCKELEKRSHNKMCDSNEHAKDLFMW